MYYELIYSRSQYLITLHCVFSISHYLILYPAMCIPDSPPPHSVQCIMCSLFHTASSVYSPYHHPSHHFLFCAACSLFHTLFCTVLCIPYSSPSLFILCAVPFLYPMTLFFTLLFMFHVPHPHVLYFGLCIPYSTLYHSVFCCICSLFHTSSFHMLLYVFHIPHLLVIYSALFNTTSFCILLCIFPVPHPYIPYSALCIPYFTPSHSLFSADDSLFYIYLFCTLFCSFSIL